MLDDAEREHRRLDQLIVEGAIARELMLHEVGELWNGHEVVYVAQSGSIWAFSHQYEAIKKAGITIPNNAYVVDMMLASSTAEPSTQRRTFTRKHAPST